MSLSIKQSFIFFQSCQYLLYKIKTQRRIQSTLGFFMTFDLSKNPYIERNNYSARHIPQWGSTGVAESVKTEPRLKYHNNFSVHKLLKCVIHSRQGVNLSPDEAAALSTSCAVTEQHKPDVVQPHCSCLPSASAVPTKKNTLGAL